MGNISAFHFSIYKLNISMYIYSANFIPACCDLAEKEQLHYFVPLICIKQDRYSVIPKADTTYLSLQNLLNACVKPPKNTVLVIEI